jgi:hypothetical protein
MLVGSTKLVSLVDEKEVIFAPAALNPLVSFSVDSELILLSVRLITAVENLALSSALINL